MKKLLMMFTGFLLAAHIWGLNLEPLSMQFKPSGRESIRTFSISNTQKQSIAVRISMTTRNIETDGKEIRNPADAYFTVFPQSLFLEPGQIQAVRVQWKGSSTLEKENAYRIIVEQLPVEEKTADSGKKEDGVSLNFLYRYVGAVYITPDNAVDDIVLVKTENADSDKFLLQFKNQGTAHAIIKDAQVTLRAVNNDGSENTITLDSDDLKVLAGANFLAESSLIEIVELPQNMQNRKIEVEYYFETTR